MTETDLAQCTRQSLLEVLGPIARLAIARDVPFAQLSELLKEAMLSQAQQLAGPQAPDSQLSLISGIYRKEVKRLKSLPSEPPSPRLGTLALVVTTWSNHPRFVDQAGEPKPLLPRAKANHAGLDQVIRQAKIDLPVATVLEALNQHQLVEQAPDTGLMQLLPDRLLGPKNAIAAQQAFGKTTGRHLQAAVENLTASPPKHFDRALHYNGLSSHSMARLVEQANESAMTLLNELNRLAYQLQQQDRQQTPRPEGEFSFGAYSLSTGTSVTLGEANA